MLGHSDQKIAVMFATLPPHRQVKAWTAKLQSLPQEGVTQDLLTDFSQELDAVQGTGGSLLSNRFHEYSGINRAYVGEGKRVQSTFVKHRGYLPRAHMNCEKKTHTILFFLYFL